MVLLVAAVVGVSAGEKRNLATDSVLKLVMDHRGKPGFETISVGRVGLGLVRMVLSAEADDPEDVVSCFVKFSFPYLLSS